MYCIQKQDSSDRVSNTTYAFTVSMGAALKFQLDWLNDDVSVYGKASLCLPRHKSMFCQRAYD
jgi:hypothetical protein